MMKKRVVSVILVILLLVTSIIPSMAAETGQVTEPVISNIASGVVDFGTEISLTSTTSDAAIYFTTNGTDPKTSDNKQTYTAPIKITSTTTIKAYAASTGNDDSATSEFVYTVKEVSTILRESTLQTSKGIVAAVSAGIVSENIGDRNCWTLNPAANRNYIRINVDDNYMFGPQAIAEVEVEYYDGAEGGKFALWIQSSPSNVCTDPVNFSGSNTWKTHTFELKNMDFSNKNFENDFLIASYVHGLTTPASSQVVAISKVTVRKVLPPVVSDTTPGQVGFGKEIALSTTTSGAAIYFTTDGTDPKISGTKQTYSAPIKITAATTIKAYATYNGVDSATKTFGYIAGEASVVLGGDNLGSTKQSSMGIVGAVSVGIVSDTVGGKNCWTLDPAANRNYIKFNVDDAYIFGLQNKVEVDVEYYDGAEGGKFALWLEAEPKPNRYSEIVEFGGSNTWKTHTFVLENVDFSNLAYGNDFLIATYISGITVPASTKVAAISKVTVRKVKYAGGVSAVLGNPPVYDGLTLYTLNSDGETVESVIDEVYSIRTNKDTEDYYIYFDVDDSFINGGSNKVDIELEYYDSFGGAFSITYDATNGIAGTSEVNLMGSGKGWVKKTFRLFDAKFANGLNNADFRVGLHTPIASNQSDISVRSVKVKKVTEPPVKMKVSSTKFGNIFTQDEIMKLTLGLENTSGTPLNLKVDYSVSDESGFTILEETLNNVEVAASSSKNVELSFNNITKFGIYDLSLKVSKADSDIDLSGVYTFSRVLSENRDIDDGIFGQCTHFAQNRVNAEENLTAAQQAGAKYIRDEMYWGHCELTKGVYTIQPWWETYVNTALSKGIKPVVILSYGNGFYNGGLTPTSDEDIAAFANYGRFIAEHFKDRVTHFEIYNEYNINDVAGRGEKSAAAYAKMLKASYEAIKGVYAGREDDVTIIGGATANNPLAWFEDLFKAGGLDYMDAISDHPYTYPFSPETGKLYNMMVNLDNLAKQYNNGVHKPIWITEIGWPTNTGARGISEYQSAIYQVQAHVISKIQNVVDVVFWYDFQNDGIDAGYNEHNFGLIRNTNNEVVPGAAKKGYIAYSALTSKLLGKEYAASYNNLDSELKIYRFNSENAGANATDTLVVWTTGKDKDVAIDLGCDTAYISDMYGNKTTLKAVDGKFNVSLSAEPAYIEGIFGDDIAIASSQLEFEAKSFEAIRGSSIQINADFNGTVPQEGAKYQVVVPLGWQSVNDVAFSIGDTSKQISVTMPANIANGTYKFYIQVALNNGDVIALSELEVVIVDSFKVTVNPAPVEYGNWDNWVISVEVTNNSSDETILGKVSLLEPSAWVSEDIDYSVAPNSKKVINIPVPGVVDQGLYDVSIRVDVNGQVKDIQKKISFLAATKTATPPVIDGAIEASEWEGAMPFYLNDASQVKFIPDWAGIDDLSGTGYLKWDNDNLYLAVEVKDNIHKQAETGGSTWKGDGIQLCIDPSRSEAPGAKPWNEIGLALSDDGIITKYRWNVVNGQTSGNFDSMDCSIIRDEETKTTIYETSMPWKDILPDGINAVVDFDFGFSLLINDNDGASRRGFIEYMSGIGETKDANAFGDALLVSNIVDPIGTDATLKDLKVNGNTIAGFAADKYEYSYSLPAGTTVVPTVAATANDSKAAATVTPATSLPGTTTIVVTAEDGTTTKTYKVNFTVQSSGGGETPVPTPAPTPAPKVEVDKQGNVIVKLPDPKLDSATGAAKSTIDTATLDKAKEDLKGNKKIVLEIPKVKDAKAYTVELPKGALTIDGAKKKEAIEMQTEFGSIELPANMFRASELTGATNVGITVAKADTSGLDKDLLNQIGARPVVELTATANGTQVNWNNPDAPVTVTIAYTPTEEELKNPGHITVWYITGDGKVVSIPNAKYDKKTGTVVFTTTHFSKYTVAYVEKTFSDAGKVTWAQKQIEVLASKGIIETDQTTFKPETNITRGEFISMLVKALGLTANTDVTFADVKKGSKYFEEISIAKKLGIAAGGNKNDFRPNEEISRQDMMVLLTKALKYAGKITEDSNINELEKFEDEAKISSYAKQSIATLVKTGIVSGEGKNMNPLGNTNKAAAACVIYNLFNY